MASFHKKAIGIDIGGSHITSVILDINGDILMKKTLPVTSRLLEDVMDVIFSCIEGMIHEDIIGIGVGVPGNVDPSQSSTRYLPNFGWFDPVPLGKLISERTGLPVTMRNDGRCAAIAECKYGVGKNSKVFAMLTLGTGIGGALIVNGQLFDGCSFDAGDFGHHVICSGTEAFNCVCGKKGCFECHASASGLVRHYNRTLQNTSSSDLSLSTAVRPPDTAYEVIERYRSNYDPYAMIAFDKFLMDLSTGLANLVTFYNPDIIALGGGLSQVPEIFDRIQLQVDAKTLPATRGYVKVLPSKLGRRAGAMGAALLALNNL